jgi:hypothetical protein
MLMPSRMWQMKAEQGVLLEVQVLDLILLLWWTYCLLVSPPI